MGRTACCDKSGLKKGPWTPEEDQRLVDYIQKHGYGNWRTLPKNAGLQRCGKSCRLRWTNYLRPDIKRGRFSFEEEEMIIQLHSILGNKWSAIASRLPGRTDNEIKNYWNTNIRKRLLRMGIDPVTHTPRLDLLDPSPILTSSLYPSASQINYNGIQQQQNLQVNPEILKLASSLFNNNITAPPLIDQNQIQDSVPNFSTQFGNMDPYPSNFHDFAMSTDWHAIQLASYSNNNNYHENLMDPPMSETSTTTFQYSNNKSNNVNYQNGQNHNNFSFATSVLSTPSSSPKPLNESSTEDEREISYVSSNYNYNNMLMRFEIPDMLDVANDFM